jgi:TrmH family RNA methyltransferase
MLSKATIKYIQSLQQKKQRTEQGVFVAEGTVMLQEMLEDKNLEAVQVFATQDWWSSLTPEWQEKYAPTASLIEDFQLKQISSRETAIGGLAIFKQKTIALQPNYDNEIVLALADLQDPGNLGTIIRTADWFGIKNIVCSKNTVDCYNPKVVQSTMGSIGRVAVHYVDLEKWLREAKADIFAAKLEGDDVKESEKPNSAILLIGNEAKGISSSYDSLKYKPIHIKRIGASESLNAAVAAGILMYEFCNGH